MKRKLNISVAELTKVEFELLQTTAAMQMELRRGPTLAELASVFQFTRARAHFLVRKLRGKGLVEDQPTRTWPGVTLSHNGKRFLEKALDAQVAE